MRGSLALLILLPAALACERETSPPPAASRLERETVLGPFLSRHWLLPVPGQGAPPAGWSAVEVSLDPALCGVCHPQQLADWRTSLHAHAYSPGFAGQLLEGGLAEPSQLRACQTCHAPLEEQQPFGPTLAASDSLDPALRSQGVVCAACHVRAHRRFGPPRRAGLPPLVEPLPHDGFEARGEFRESRFCAQCHQFFDDPGPAGKPLENTWAEWRASPQAAAGRQCQDCHMPDRRHLWRGIHDPDTVRAAVDAALLANEADGRVRADLVVANRDVGHAFPSYVTPRVFLSIYQVDPSGNELADTRLEAVIGREVDLGTGTERFDTRVLPGESAKLAYDRPRASQGVAVVGRVWIDPDFHYRNVFATLSTAYASEPARAEMREALRRIADSGYLLSEIRRELSER